MSYRSHGYEIVPGLLTALDCEIINIEATLKHAGKPHVAMAHQTMDSVKQALRLPQIVAKVEELIGAPSALTSEYFFGHPGTQGFNYHQDNKFIQTPTMVSCWIALTDVDPTNGCLLAFPGSHTRGLLPVGPHDPRNRVDAVEAPDGLLAPLPMKRGDAIFMDGHLVHGSYANESHRNRESLTIAFIPKGAPFRAGRYGRTEIIL